ncbi:hypothetical protein M569_14416, partial [Genlisea aurea]
EESEDEELADLEEEVNEMARKILQYRNTLPDQLTSTLSSRLTARRSLSPVHLPDRLAGRVTESESVSDSEAGLSRGRCSCSFFACFCEIEEIRLLKEKLSNNTCKLPIVLKRMKDCITRMDRLESSSGGIGVIHPAFKRK